MAVRYRNTAYSIAGILWQIDIGDSAYSGAVNLFNTGGEIFNLSYKGLTERCDPLMASTLTVPFQIETTTHEAFVNSIMAAQEERFTVQIYRNTVLYWSGVLLADQVQTEDIAYPYIVDLTFTDGLARLKDLDYSNNGAPYTGRETLLAIITRCLSRTGTSVLYGSGDYFLATSVNWYDIRHQYWSTKCPLAYTTLDNGIFSEVDQDGIYTYKTCSEVLEMILRTFNATIMLSGGYYRIKQQMDDSRGNFYIRYFTKSGTYITNGQYNYRSYPTVGERKTGGSFKYFPPLKQVRKVYKPRISVNNTGSILPVQQTYTPAINMISFIPAGISLFFEGNVRERFWLEDPSGNITLWSEWRLDIILTHTTLGTKYYLTNSGPGFIWSTDSSKYFGIRGPVMQGNGWDVTWPISVVTPVAPAECTATFEFKLINLYRNGVVYPWVANGDFYLAEYYDFTVIPDLTDDLADCSDIEFKAINTIAGGGTVASTFKIDLPETLIGDGPQVIHIGKLMTSSNGSDYDESTAWGVHNSSSRANINQLSVNELLKGQRVPVEKFMGGFINNGIFAHNSIVWGSKVMVPITFNVSPASDEVSGEWFNCIIPS